MGYLGDFSIQRALLIVPFKRSSRAIGYALLRKLSFSCLLFLLSHLSTSENLDDEQWSLGPTFGFGRHQTHPPTNPNSRTVTDLRNRANQGNPEAQYFLGLLMWYGDGVGTDRDTAMDLFRKAAKHVIKNDISPNSAYIRRFLLILLRS